MGNVLEFPSQQAQGLAFLDRQIRQLLTDKGADGELIEFAAKRLTDIYARINESEQYSFSVHLPDSLESTQRDSLQLEINAGLEGIRKGNHSLMLELIAKLVLAEVQLFQLSRDQ
jgi:hypothetical protein